MFYPSHWWQYLALYTAKYVSSAFHQCNFACLTKPSSHVLHTVPVYFALRRALEQIVVGSLGGVLVQYFSLCYKSNQVNCLTNLLRSTL